MAQDTCQDRPQAEPSKQSPPDARALIPTPSQVLLEEKAPKQHTERTSPEATQQPQRTVAQGPGEGWRRPKHSPAPGEVAHKGL